MKENELPNWFTVDITNKLINLLLQQLPRSEIFKDPHLRLDPHDRVAKLANVTNYYQLADIADQQFYDPEAVAKQNPDYYKIIIMGVYVDILVRQTIQDIVNMMRAIGRFKPETGIKTENRLWARILFDKKDSPNAEFNMGFLSSFINAADSANLLAPKTRGLIIGKLKEIYEYQLGNPTNYDRKDPPKEYLVTNILYNTEQKAHNTKTISTSIRLMTTSANLLTALKEKNLNDFKTHFNPLPNSEKILVSTNKFMFANDLIYMAAEYRSPAILRYLLSKSLINPEKSYLQINNILKNLLDIEFNRTDRNPYIIAVLINSGVESSKRYAKPNITDVVVQSASDSLYNNLPIAARNALATERGQSVAVLAKSAATYIASTTAVGSLISISGNELPPQSSDENPFLTADIEGKTALHYCAENGWVGAAKILLDQGHPINAITKKNLTALHTAAMHNQYEFCRFLISNGAKTDIGPEDLKDESGNIYKNRPINIAIDLNHTDIIALLMLVNGSKVYNRKTYNRFSVSHVFNNITYVILLSKTEADKAISNNLLFRLLDSEFQTTNNLNFNFKKNRRFKDLDQVSFVINMIYTSLQMINLYKSFRASDSIDQTLKGKIEIAKESLKTKLQDFNKEQLSSSISSILNHLTITPSPLEKSVDNTNYFNEIYKKLSVYLCSRLLGNFQSSQQSEFTAREYVITSILEHFEYDIEKNKNADGANPLHLACYLGNLTLVEKYIHADKINETDKHNNTYLHYVIKGLAHHVKSTSGFNELNLINYLKIIDHLVAKKINLEAKNTSLYTAMNQLLLYIDKEAAKALPVSDFNNTRKLVGFTKSFTPEKNSYLQRYFIILEHLIFHGCLTKEAKLPHLKTIHAQIEDENQNKFQDKIGLDLRVGELLQYNKEKTAEQNNIAAGQRPKDEILIGANNLSSDDQQFLAELEGANNNAPTSISGSAASNPSTAAVQNPNKVEPPKGKKK